MGCRTSYKCRGDWSDNPGATNFSFAMLYMWEYEKSQDKGMKHILMICVVAMLVSGCSNEPTGAQYKEAQHWCDNFGGVKAQGWSDIKGLVIQCLDGTIIIKSF